MSIFEQFGNMSEILGVSDQNLKDGENCGVLKDITNITQGLVNSSSFALQKTEQLSKVTRSKIRKDYEISEVFIPTDKQLEFLRSIFSPKTGSSVDEWLEYCGMSQAVLGQWLTDSKFLPWLVGEAEKRMILYKLEFLKTGIVKMKANVQTWAEMGRIFFYPRGSEFSPPEKGSKREALEKEMKRLVDKKEKIIEQKE